MPLPSEDLEPLVTECPNCQTRFRVSESQLQVANGRVRCGACLKVFLGTDYLQWDREPAADDRAPDDTLDELLGELELDSPAPPESVRWFDDVAITEGASKVATDHQDAAGEDYAPLQEAAGQKGVMPQHYAPLPWVEDAANDVFGAVDHQAGRPDESPDDLEIALTADDLLANLTEQLPEVEAADEQAAEDTSEAAALYEALALPEEPAFERSLPMDASPDEPLPKEDTTPLGEEAAVEAYEGREPIPPQTEKPLAAGTAQAVEASDLDMQLPPGGWDVGDLEAEAPPPRRRWPYVAGALLVAFLVAQAVYLLWPSMEKTPEQRWLPETVCAVTGCELEPLRDVDQLVLNNVIVRGHPELEGVLVVDVLFVNAADFPQAWPEIELSFNTNAGQLVAWRRFKPEEYLAGAFVGSREIAAKTPAHVSVEIKDPGPGSDRYEVSLR